MNSWRKCNKTKSSFWNVLQRNSSLDSQTSVHSSCLIVIKGCNETELRVYICSDVFSNISLYFQAKLNYQSIEMRSAHGFTAPEEQHKSQNQLHSVQYAHHHHQPEEHVILLNMTIFSNKACHVWLTINICVCECLLDGHNKHKNCTSDRELYPMSPCKKKKKEWMYTWGLI